LIRTARNILAAAGSAAILAGGMALAGAGAASAATLPNCPTTHCSNDTAGMAGYYGADDNHTHYRYVQTVTTAAPQLVNLNGNYNPNAQGAVGVELCDPNIGFAAQLSLANTPAGYQVRYRVGFFIAPKADPCIQTGLTQFTFQSGNVLGLNGVSTGDQVELAIWYDPNTSGHHFHQLSFGACDITAGVCRQAYSGSHFNLNFWEFGIGAITHSSTLTAPADNALDTFSSNMVTCYSCSHMVPITAVSPVNPFGIGGLTESQFLNSSSQVTMSPNNSLSASDDFTVYNGSTSV
jgi:hypothetical protein